MGGAHWRFREGGEGGKSQVEGGVEAGELEAEGGGEASACYAALLPVRFLRPQATSHDDQ